jgi:lysyl-tRNA synthetase class 2
VADAFLRYGGIRLDPLPDRPSFAQAAAAIGVRIADDDSWDDIFFKIFLERIEAHLGIGCGTILIDYPIHMAALSRPKPGTPHLAERFELYLCGLELANAFGELTDAHEQARRFAADMDLKQALNGVRYPVDPTFLAAVERLPDCAGIALGFDRLVMLLTGAKRIDDVLWLPVASPDGDRP